MTSTDFTYEDLLEWSEKRPLWQRDALRRLLSGPVSDTDYDELAGLAETEAIAPREVSSAAPATTDHVQPSSTTSPSVSLLDLDSIAHVGALAPGPIPFGESGLTVVYGENASGKSGVASVFKRACRALAVNRPMLPNLNEPDPGKPASAEISYRVTDGTNSNDCKHLWIDGQTTPKDLRSVNVFDVECASAQVAKANHIEYTPTLLSVFRELAHTCEEVKDRLTKKETQLGSRPAVLVGLELEEGTAAATFVERLSGESSAEVLESLCDVSEEENAHLESLNKSLSGDPARAMKISEDLLATARELRRVVEISVASLSDEAFESVRELVSDAVTKRDAAEIARETAFTDVHLEGVGGDVWSVLWESARRYSESEAYGAESFPVTGEESRCVLCQQPLDEAARDRLGSFEQFVQADTKKVLAAARRCVESRLAKLRALEIPTARQAVRALATDHEGIAESTRRFLVVCKLRRRWLLQQLESLSVTGHSKPATSGHFKTSHFRAFAPMRKITSRKGARSGWQTGS
ncbi:MAG: hypothetical protein AB7O52_08510, partial [Planctomycetota bacterium]